MVSVLRDGRDTEPERWPTLTQSLITAARVASTAVDLVIRQFRATRVYVECDETGDLVVIVGADGGRWVHAYSRRGWVPGVDCGQDVDLLGLTGMELTRRLPASIGVRLDPGHDHTFVIVAAAALPLYVDRDDVPVAGGAE